MRFKLDKPLKTERDQEVTQFAQVLLRTGKGQSEDPC